jgi:class 3 adenylate cyclase
MEQPLDIRYARSGDVHLAYHVVGEGPIDLVLVTGYTSNVASFWQEPVWRAFFERLASFSRLIRFDRRGSGLSDRPRDVATLETRMDDLRAVMAAAGSSRAAIVATYEAAAMAMLFAATYPERVAALVLYQPYAKLEWAPDYPLGEEREELLRELDEMEEGWGTIEYAEKIGRMLWPERAEDPEFRRWQLDNMRYSASPASALTIWRMAIDIDVRDVLPAIRVPTLVFHRSDEPATRRRKIHTEASRYVAERIPGAKRVEMPGGAEPLVSGDVEMTAAEIERFVTAAWEQAEPDTVLTTVLFTDIVGSTEKAAELGDTRWVELVGRHHALVRRQLDQFRGRELDTAGDGFFATFDGPARAIRCARAIAESVRQLGLEIRAGLHTAECEVIGDKVGGIAVNVGARIAANARSGEVLVSSTVKDLVAGSGIAFDDRGACELKGIPGEWRLYAVAK